MTGIVIAVCAAAASTSAVLLTATVLASHYTPLHLGLLYVPELGAAVISALAFGAVFDTRLIHYYALGGMAVMAAGIVVIQSAVPPTAVLTLVGSGLIGIGIGASVTPALFLAGFSLRSATIQRVFAILELLRAVAAFLVAPVLPHFATTLTGLPAAAASTALWICFGLSAGGALVGVLLYVLGGVRPSAPALPRWMGGQEPAWESPPLLAAVRRGLTGRVRAAGETAARRDALVLTVWRTFSVGFVPEPGAGFNAACAGEVRETAAHGAAQAGAAGFRAQPVAIQGTPTWKAIADAADDNGASLIVIGSYGRAGVGGRVAGSVAGSIMFHSQRPVLVVHDHTTARSAASAVT